MAKIKIKMPIEKGTTFDLSSGTFVADNDGTVEVDEFSQDHFDLLALGGAVVDDNHSEPVQIV